MSLVLLAVVVVIWASLLLPLIFRDRSTWPSRRAPAQARPGDPVAAEARRGRAIWRPPAGPPRDRVRAGAGTRDRRLPPAGGSATHRTRAQAARGPGAHPGRARAARGPGAPPAGARPARGRAAHRTGARPAPGAGARRAMFRRRRLLVVLVAAALAALVPALALGGSWRTVAAAGALPAAYLAALGAAAPHRRRTAARPGRRQRPPRPVHLVRPESTVAPLAVPEGTVAPLSGPAAAGPAPLSGPAAPDPATLGAPRPPPEDTGVGDASYLNGLAEATTSQDQAAPDRVTGEPAAQLGGLRAWRAARAGTENGAGRWAALLHGHAPPSTE